jgi:hypothetical protein
MRFPIFSGSASTSPLQSRTSSADASAATGRASRIGAEGIEPSRTTGLKSVASAVSLSSTHPHVHYAIGTTTDQPSADVTVMFDAPAATRVSNPVLETVIFAGTLLA